MEKFAINKKMLRQLTLMNNHREPSLEVIDSLLAQIFLEVSVYRFKRSSIQKEIDTALETGNKELFKVLATKYNEILSKYKDGIHVSEQGFEFTMNLDE
ncbi:IDEAL domain-containing protein (plasmid) [Anaerobacillus sp. CMMVII]|uniref:IDEAL domain-containing protein n=1 Tax=Anaerobacillus sp. CMMVII TaxID=2755588 RepID=UPI0021B7F7DB|nr:IDEAL domain-containing protein [Anaerobacillus sp. CMMVII]MCT8139218.1 IDEAL domain-containing protein [Anaerobacillus sp. CMMVII]